MPGTPAGKIFTTMALTSGSNYFVVVFLLFSETSEFSLSSFLCFAPYKRNRKKNVNFNLP